MLYLPDESSALPALLADTRGNSREVSRPSLRQVCDPLPLWHYGACGGQFILHTMPKELTNETRYELN